MDVLDSVNEPILRTSCEWFAHLILHPPLFENHSDSCLFQILTIFNHSEYR